MSGRSMPDESLFEEIQVRRGKWIRTLGPAQNALRLDTAFLPLFVTARVSLGGSGAVAGGAAAT
jgi:hypothetical protein